MTDIKLNFCVEITKEKEVYFVYSKLFNITGYGKTKKEAINSFETVVQIVLKETRLELNKYHSIKEKKIWQI